MANGGHEVMVAGFPHPNCSGEGNDVKFFVGDPDEYFPRQIRKTRRYYMRGEYIGHL